MSLLVFIFILRRFNIVARSVVRSLVRSFVCSLVVLRKHETLSELNTLCGYNKYTQTNIQSQCFSFFVQVSVILCVDLNVFFCLCCFPCAVYRAWINRYEKSSKNHAQCVLYVVDVAFNPSGTFAEITDNLFARSFRSDVC